MKIFLSSHSKLASGIKSSIDFLMGSSEKLIVYDAYLDDNNLEDVINNFIESLGYNEKVLFLSDIYGGSVNQILSKYVDNERFFLISGANLPLTIEALMIDDINGEIVDYLVDLGKNSISKVDLKNIALHDDIDDFFE